MAKYNLFVDADIPYEFEVNSEKELLKELKKLKKKVRSGFYNYSDLIIEDETGKDVTEIIFSKYKSVFK